MIRLVVSFVAWVQASPGLKFEDHRLAIPLRFYFSPIRLRRRRLRGLQVSDDVVLPA